MIEHIAIKNFQSLTDVDLELHGLTVIVGASSVGKSAFIRALSTLVSNRRGTDFITYGERLMTISARTEHGHVTLTRGKGTSDNEYVLTPASDPGAEKRFSKLGGETPPEVSAFLGIPSKDPINFAGQFDKPYLLDESAGEVARTLGALTNVNVIFEAARESNRRKTGNAATLRTRQADLEAIMAKVPQYKNLQAQTAALAQAETHVENARTLQERITRLEKAIGILTVTQDSLPRLQEAASRIIPSDENIVRAGARLTRFRDTMAAVSASAAAVKTHTAAVEQAEATLQAQNKKFADALKGISTGIEEAIRTKADIENDRVTVPQASNIAAEYIAGVLT